MQLSGGNTMIITTQQLKEQYSDYVDINGKIPYSHLKFDNKIESANIISECFAKKEEPKPIIEQVPTIEIKTQTQPPKTQVDLDYEIKILERELEYKKQLRKKQSDFER